MKPLRKDVQKLAGVRVLLAEDSSSMRKLLRALLEPMGIRDVVEVDNTSAAMKQIQENKFDLIIVDWQMKPANGIELVKQIRGDKTGAFFNVPIIMVTSHASLELVWRARDAGVHEILIKPVSAKVMQKHLETIFDKPRDFIRQGGYAGPDRRRRPTGHYKGPDRRASASEDGK